MDTFVKLMKRAGLDTMLTENGPFTVFAPSDDAFDDLSKEAMSFLTSEAGASALKDLLLYHIISDDYMDTDDMEDETSGFAVTTTLQEDVRISYKEKQDGLSVDLKDSTTKHAKVEDANIRALNGIIHVIDSK